MPRDKTETTYRDDIDALLLTPPADAAVGYARQSKTAAHELLSRDSLSAETQLTKDRQYADIFGWRFLADLSQQTIDLDTPGSQRVYTRSSARRKKRLTPSWQQRPGLMRLLQEAAQGKFQHLVCYKLDRLGRDAAELYQIRDAFREHGVTLHIVSEGIRSDTAGGELVFAVLAAVAEMERRNIADRNRDVALQRARRGLHHSRPPGWLTLVPGTTPADGPAHFAIHPEHGANLTRLAELRLSGLSYTDIARLLNTEGRQSPGGGDWTMNNVRDALSAHSRQRYRGHATFHGHRPDSRDPVLVISRNVFPPLFSPEFSDSLDRAQEVMENARRHSEARTEARKGQKTPYRSSDYILSGIAACALCGTRLVGSYNVGRQGEKILRYHCPAAATGSIPHPGKDAGRKGGMIIAANRAEGAVLFALADLQNRLKDREQTSGWRQKPTKTVTGKKTSAAPAPRPVEVIEAAIDRLLALVEEGRLSETDYDRRYRQLAEEREQSIQAEVLRAEQQDADQQAIALERLATSGPVGEWARSEVRLLLRQLCARIELPVTVDGVLLPRVRTTTADPLLEHVRLVLHEPLLLPRLSRTSKKSIAVSAMLAAMYNARYSGDRRLDYIPASCPDTSS